jgi:DNA-binding MarR family transcriptional regulator
MGTTKVLGGAAADVPADLSADVAEWRELLARHAAVNCALERELAGHELGVSEYEVLERLAETAECSARAQQLAGEVHLSQSALSRVIARLEKAGLVDRTMCLDDRRGIFVKLTEQGARRQADAQPTHRKVLAEHLH